MRGGGGGVILFFELIRISVKGVIELVLLVGVANIFPPSFFFSFGLVLKRLVFLCILVPLDIPIPFKLSSCAIRKPHPTLHFSSLPPECTTFPTKILNN